MIHIFDDALPEEDLAEVQSKMWQWPVDDTWFDFGSDPVVEKIIGIAGRYFDLSSALGYEMHRNDHTPYPHYDKDEALYKKTGQVRFSLCGIVYYPYEKDLEMGHLLFNEISIKPITNRLVVFRPDLFHTGVQHKGTRVSIGINPWDNKPLSYVSEQK
jgi:hypothetical protein